MHFSYSSVIWLSTAPFKPLTHWYQIRCLFQKPIDTTKGQELSGVVLLTANEGCVYSFTQSPSHPCNHTHIYQNPHNKHMHTHTLSHTHTHTRTHYRLSYDITVELGIAGTNICTTSNYDLKKPLIRYVTSPVPSPVPSLDYTNPTESYFDSNEIQDMPVEDTPLGSVVPTNEILVPLVDIPTAM